MFTSKEWTSISQHHFRTEDHVGSGLLTRNMGYHQKVESREGWEGETTENILFLQKICSTTCVTLSVIHFIGVPLDFQDGVVVTHPFLDLPNQNR